MVEPLTADLLACAITHCFLYIVAFLVCIKGIQPYKNHIFILRLELRLAVYRPRKVPVFRAVLYGDNAACCYLAHAWVTLADIHNISDYLIVRGRYCGAHPVRSVNIAAELVGVAVFAVLRLCRNSLPHIPRFTESVLYTG